MKLKLLAVACRCRGCFACRGGDVTYRNDVAPLLKKYCAECHAATADAPSMADFKLDEEKYKKAKVGPRSDTYEHLLQLVNGNSHGRFHAPPGRWDQPLRQRGKPGNMYKYLGETEAERAANFKIVNAWVVGEGNKWDMNGIGQRGEMPAHHPGTTEKNETQILI